MGRKPRLHVPGGLYHVILRGNDRQTIFFSDKDYGRWTKLIARGLARYLHRIHAWCWMPNHVHIALQAGEQPIAAFMQYVASLYARQTNKLLDRSGHLFERRYRAILVESNPYLLTLIRYIHMNPVRAGLVENLLQYPWSSHASYMGLATCDFLTVDWVLSTFSARRRQALARYEKFMGGDSTEGTEIRLSEGTEQDDRILGSERFVEQVSRQSKTPGSPRDLDAIVSVFCEQYGIREVELCGPSRCRLYSHVRALIADQARNAGVATLAQVARRFNRSNAALSLAVRNLRLK